MNKANSAVGGSRFTKKHRAIVLGLVVLASAAMWLWWRSGATAHDADKAVDQPARQSAEAAQATPDPVVTEPYGSATVVPAGAHASRETAEVMACHSQTQARLEAIRARLDPAASSADAFAHYALGRVLDPQSDQHATLEHAMALWPDSSELAWAYAQACHGAACDRAVALQHLARTDPHNVSTWDAVLVDAKRRKDLAAYVHALHRAAQGHAYDSRAELVFTALRGHLAEEPPPAVCEALLDRDRRDTSTSLMDWVDMLAMVQDPETPSASAWSWCASERTIRQSPEHVRACRTALEQMAAADTVAQRLTAATLLEQLASDPMEAAQRQRELRELRWLLHVQQLVVHQNGPGETMGRLARGDYHALRAMAALTGRWPPPDHFDPRH